MLHFTIALTLSQYLLSFRQMNLHKTLSYHILHFTIPIHYANHLIVIPTKEESLSTPLNWTTSLKSLLLFSQPI
jgi:hypothetical protein